MRKTTKTLSGLALVACVALLVTSCQGISPIPFDHQLGKWHEFDLVVGGSAGDVPPTVITDCDRHLFVYSVASRAVLDCQDFGPIQGTVDDAVQQALNYFHNQFRCADPKCIKKVGRIVWTGWSCSKDRPRSAIAAVVVEMWCTVEL